MIKEQEGAFGSRMAAVDVVIPVFNGLPFIKDCIQSCLDQTLPDIRIKVFDNASTDGTSQWLDDRAHTEPRICVHHNPSNIGMFPNIRRCFASISADNFCFLCADDAFYSKSALEIAAGVLASNPDLGVVYSDMAYIDAHGRDMAYRRFARRGEFAVRQTGLQSILAARNFFGIPVLTRSIHAAAAEFDEIFSYTADVDMAIRLADFCKAWHHPEVLIANRYHAANATFRLQRNVGNQFLALAERHGFALTRMQKLQVHTRAVLTGLLKKFFILYAAARHPVSL
jgi:glycosyltransferase involved in cell wall biosynthesis